ncbi:elongation of very long chain fatty acids protein-like protein [Dinothrombium tinctorium]|uniref:Elongation of very long chain fatty acids protein n=1 Tax=Dinothrombium tinctorium TaxID=1965070 RepID=A0A3S3P216_9ACAR|nr:elongation of very long chain fatty acids protein-like protein [Dinothrombium tinctorium]RWS13294.1 elongation of very long chain fatty acids protein-like protein [Dinothrombium tinctorium]
MELLSDRNTTTKTWPRSGNLLQYLLTDIWEIGSDPRVSKLPLMNGGPWLLLAIIAFYLYFSTYLGPRLMKSRKAYDLRSVIRIYNFIMMCFNGYFFVLCAYHTDFGLKTWGCHPIILKEADDMWHWKLKMIWFFLLSKFVDLLETVFFVLRKKDSQLSALHIFHHSIVPLDVWVGMRYSPSESACFFPFINSFVHMLMYLYYGLSTFGESMRPYLWWKKYLTQLQILQLSLISLHCFHLVLLPDCNIPKALFAIYLPQAILLVYLFVVFFIDTYAKNARKFQSKTD